MATHRLKTSFTLLVFAGLATVAGCDQIDALMNKGKADDTAQQQGAPQGGQQMPPPPVVDVIVAQPQTLTRTSNLPARLEASRTAVIVPRVSGIVEARLFDEGAKVEAGQPLYQLDKGTFMATLKTAEGNVASAKANIANSEATLLTAQADFENSQAAYETARATYKTAEANVKSAKAAVGQSVAQRDLASRTVTRYRKLIKSNAISQQELDQARSNLKVQQSGVNVADANISSAKAAVSSAKAGVSSAKAGIASAKARITAAQAGINAAKAGIASAEASVEAAKINLGYTEIKAPISGMIGLSKVTEGAYVNASQTQMAEIQQLDPLYVNITQPASAIMALRKAQQTSAAKTGDDRTIQLVLEDGTPYPHKGRLLFVNQSVNESTGEMTIRAEVPNPDGELIPGLYVRVNVAQEKISNAYLIPQQAVTRGKMDTVMVAEADGSYHPQPVTVSGQQNQDWIVTGGLQPGTAVIIDGMGQMAIMMGAPKVQTRPWGQATQTEATAPVIKQEKSTKAEPVKSKTVKPIEKTIKADATPQAESREIELISDQPESSTN